MTDDTTDDEPTHSATIDDDTPSVREALASLVGRATDSDVAHRGKIRADRVRTDTWHLPYNEQIEVYVSHGETEYRVVERDGELALDKTDD